MKRILAFMLLLTMVFALCACGSAKKEEQLKEAVKCIKAAEDSIVSVSTKQIERWTKYSDILICYFDDDAYESNPLNEPTLKKAADTIHENRISAKENLEKAKELIKNTGDGDLYEAVKEYYKSVGKFYSLISTFPEGYSKLTFMQAVADYKAECQAAYEEVDFNMG